MPRLRPPPGAKPITPMGAVLAMLDMIAASQLSGEAKVVANMLALNNFVLGKAMLSGRRFRHRVPAELKTPNAEE